KVRLARIWVQVKGGIDRGFCQLEASGRVIDLVQVKLIVRLSQPAICEKKSRVSRDRLVEPLYGLEIILLLLFPLLVRGLVDHRLRSDIKVVGNKVFGR